MGVNQQTSVPAFTAGQVLTAQQQTEINTGVPVFADTTARDAAFGGTGEKVLAEGQMAYVENLDVVQYYDGSVWATVGPASPGGLAFISQNTLTATSTSFSLAANTFSATYDNYRIIVAGAQSASAAWTMRLRAAGVDASGTNYTNGLQTMVEGTTTFVGISNSNGTSFKLQNFRTFENFLIVDLINPFATKRSGFNVSGHGANSSGTYNDKTGAGRHEVATSYDAATFLWSTGTFTGTISTYGYAKA
jgi:hypothetical protein